MATTIGSLVAEMVLNSARFKNDVRQIVDESQKAGDGVARGLNRGAAGANNAAKGFKEVALTTRQLGGTLANTISPALGETVGLFGSLGTAMSRLPVAAGVAVAGIGAVVAATVPIAKRAADVIDALGEIRFAGKTGDINSLLGSLQQAAKEVSNVQTAAEQAGNALPNLFKGEFAEAGRKIIANFRVEVDRFSGTVEAAGTKAAAAGVEILKFLPREVAINVAAFNAALQKTNASSAQFQATLAETFNDEDRFTASIEKSIEALKEEARQTDIANKERAKQAQIAAAGNAALNAEARAALEAKISEELQHQLDLTGEQLRLSIDQLRERQRLGQLGIRERRQAPFGPEPGIEEVGRSEGLAAGITPDPDVIKAVRAATKGFEEDLAELHATAQLLGPDFNEFAAKSALLASEMQRLIAAGLDPTDDKLKELQQRFRDSSISAAVKDLSEATRVANTEGAVFGKGFDSASVKIEATRAAINRLISTVKNIDPAALKELTDEFDRLQVEALTSQLDQQRDVFLKTDREVAIYAANLKLSADASDELRQRTAELAGAIFDLQDQQRLYNDAISIGVSAATQLGDALYDTLTGQEEDFAQAVKRIIHSLNKMILTMIIAELVARALKAALSSFGGGSTGAEGASGGIGTADIIRPTAAASGAIVKARPGGHLMLVGEGGRDEGIFPLDTMNQVGTRGDVTVVNEIHNHTSSQVTTQQSQGPDGKLINKIIITAVNNALTDGSTDNAMRSSYGLRRVGVSR